MPDILIRKVSDEVASALQSRADAEGMTQQAFLSRELERIAQVKIEPGKVRLDLRHPQAPRFIWGRLTCDHLRLRSGEATAVLNAFGTGGGQGMNQELHAAKRLAGDHINKARALDNEDIGADIVALLEAAGWEVFPG